MMENPFIFDDLNYQQSQDKKFAEYEARCQRCGACCGAIDDDPCAQLVRNNKGEFECRIYNKRFGLQTTVKGLKFCCRPIHSLKMNNELPAVCGYKKTSD